MGHGDVIAFGDANFPAESSKASYVVRADGIPDSRPVGCGLGIVSH